MCEQEARYGYIRSLQLSRSVISSFSQKLDFKIVHTEKK